MNAVLFAPRHPTNIVVAILRQALPKAVLHAVCVMIIASAAVAESFAQYRLGFNPTLVLPIGGFAANVPQFNAGFTTTVYRYTSQTPISLGGSVGFQVYDVRADRKGKDYTFDMISFPLTLGFHVNLLPDFVLNPYYGAEAGAVFFRYRAYTPALETSFYGNIGAVLAPNGGFRIEIVEGLLLDLNVRYQWVFHDTYQYGPSEQYRIQGYTTLGVAVGFSYAVNGSARR
jgi:hypothetical protein